MSKKSDQSILQDITYPQRLGKNGGIYLFILHNIFLQLRPQIELTYTRYILVVNVKGKGKISNPVPEKARRSCCFQSD